MGFTVTINDGHVTIMKDQKIYKEYDLRNWEEMMMKSLNGADYVDRYTWRPDWEVAMPGEDQAIDADDYSIGVGWNHFMNTTDAQLHQDFSAAQREWNKSPEHGALITQMQDLKKANGNWRVTNLVGLGIGSLHDKPNKRSKDRSNVQLAALLAIRSFLGEPLNPLPCVVQDPAYSELKKDFLRSSLKLEVVDDPDAFSCINAGSLVLNIGTYFDMAWWMSTGTWPAAMITSDWGNPRPGPAAHAPPFCRQRVRSMFQHYDSKPLIPGNNDDDAGRWARVNLYWRRQSQDMV